jgi:hypothetical protein
MNLAAGVVLIGDPYGHNILTSSTDLAMKHVLPPATIKKPRPETWPAPPTVTLNRRRSARVGRLSRALRVAAEVWGVVSSLAIGEPSRTAA